MVARNECTFLGDLINMVLQKGEGELRYYQGYHDVALIFLTVFTAQRPNLGLSSAVLFQISRSHLRDFMEDYFSSLTSAMKLVLSPRRQNSRRCVGVPSPLFILFVGGDVDASASSAEDLEEGG